MNIGNDKAVSELISKLAVAKKADGPIKACGTWGSFAPMLAGHISKELKRPILYVSAHIDDADNVGDDLGVFIGKAPDTFPVWEDQDQFADATDEIAAQRLRLVLSLTGHGRSVPNANTIITTSIQALNQPVPGPKLLRQGGLSLETNQTIELELIVNWLIDNGFERVDSIDMPGQFAQRGGIVDIFAPVTTGIESDSAQTSPIRVEFFGDCLESIRTVDLDTQRSAQTIDKVCVIGSSSHEKLEETELFVNLLPEDTIIIVDEPMDVQEVSEIFISRLDDAKGLYPFDAVYRAMNRFTLMEIQRFGSGGDDVIELGVTSAQEFESGAGAVWKEGTSVIEKLLDQQAGRDIILYCENTAELQRVKEIIKDSPHAMPKNFQLIVGFIHQGFVIASLSTIVLAHHQLFGQYAVRRRIRTVRSTSPVENMLDLKKGDYVVHISYGIGKFLGMKSLEKNGSTNEYLTIEFAEKVLIHVPVSNITLIQKYIGTAASRPELSKIGSKKWENQKRKVAEGVKELAIHLLEVHAQRQNLGGHSFGKDTTWQKEFDGSFLYQETPDQLKAIAEIKADMIGKVPMDRLLCGDVGYGKTEMSMRAAFKAVEAGKQVAVLVPTTVLCVQHGRTFTERFADFPITIETLNRFKTPKQAKKVVSDLRLGKVDIVIGTHRVLSKDVGFADLGLVVIDEEQRFGVEHKERLKDFRVNVDVLTMTATPIPRTLHLSMLGLRDISSLNTPPMDRRSITTRVCRYDKRIVKKAIFHELNRQGQIFFLHNRVQSIEHQADEIAKLIDDPKVMIDIAHGQMTKTQLERAMLKFVRGQTHILVCSTIIESGLDIPNANTMIINEADRFGLAQLHQLRGRVGRYKHRAYAYMLLPATRSVSPIAAKRLKAIEEYSQLGAGFRIALRDLQIRGAGNILGSEQSGHINTVGYEMYCKMLSDTVKGLRDEPVEKPPTTLVDLGFSTFIPKSYIPADRQRMDVYRRIAVIESEKDLELLKEELADLFGPVPEKVDELLDLTQIRIRASAWNIKSLIAADPDLIFKFEDPTAASDLFARAPGKVRIIDPQTVNLRLEKNYFNPQTMMSVLRKLFGKTPRR